MITIPKEITAIFFNDRYPMSTGSGEWRDIKADFELEDGAIMGTVSKVDANAVLEMDKVISFKSDLEKFKIRVDHYNPKDEVETKEKEILQNKVNAGLEIYKAILD